MGSGTSGVPACPDASFGRTSARSHSNIVSYTQGNGASKAARARYCRHANPSDSGGATVSIVAAIEGSAASYARTIVVCHAKVTVAASKRTSADASVRVSTAATGCPPSNSAACIASGASNAGITSSDAGNAAKEKCSPPASRIDCFDDSRAVGSRTGFVAGVLSCTGNQWSVCTGGSGTCLLPEQWSGE